MRVKEKRLLERQNSNYIFQGLSRVLVTLLALVLGLQTIGPSEIAQAAAQPNQFRYFEQTGHSLNGAISRFYERNGGVERHGFPLSELISVKGKYQQFFERSLLEFSPEYNSTEFEVKQLPLGTLGTAGRTFAPSVPLENNLNQWYFPETGHSLSYGFLEFWRNRGERASLGLPISEEMDDTPAGGPKTIVQYFEYVRLEYQPDLAGSDNAMQIGALGRKRATEQLTAAELASVSLTKLEQPRAVRLPSLMFHYVRNVDIRKDPLGFGLSVTQDNFVKFADWIQQNGYHTVTVAQVNDYLRYGVALPDKPVNLRFDDGHADQWFAYQELKKRGMTATFFVISQRLELSPAQWQQVDTDGFEVAAHTRTHPDLRGSRDLEGEIRGSKQDLEAILGHPVRSFAYPYGKYGPTILQVVRDSGYESAVTTNGGYGWTPDNYFVQPTLSVTGNDNVESFASKIGAAPRAALANSQPAPDSSETTTRKDPTKAVIPIKTNPPAQKTSKASTPPVAAPKTTAPKTTVAANPAPQLTVTVKPK